VHLWACANASAWVGVLSQISKDTRAPLMNVPVSVTIVLFTNFTRPLVAKVSVEEANKITITMAKLHSACCIRDTSRRTPLLLIATPLLNVVLIIT
jgi:hypothetical protein